jgi:hypothetical protein
MPLRAVSRPSHSVHGSPWTSPEVHWLHASLAHEWRTIATPCVLLKTTRARFPGLQGRVDRRRVNQRRHMSTEETETTPEPQTPEQPTPGEPGTMPGAEPEPAPEPATMPEEPDVSPSEPSSAEGPNRM